MCVAGSNAGSPSICTFNSVIIKFHHHIWFNLIIKSTTSHDISLPNVDLPLGGRNQISHKVRMSGDKLVPSYLRLLHSPT